jgi:cathepsin L
MDKKLIALLIALVSFAAVTFILNPHHKSGDMTFAEWKIEHGLMQDLSESEEQYRLKVYQENVRIINEHNSKLGKSYEMGINKFTAYTKEEFAFLYLSKFETPSSYDISMEPAVKSVGADVNWVSFGAVSPVKDQGQCTASYAFSAVGGIEGISVIYYRNQVEYSVQQVVDCSAGYGNNGCVSGNMVASFNYIAAKGIDSLI